MSPNMNGAAGSDAATVWHDDAAHDEQYDCGRPATAARHAGHRLTTTPVFTPSLFKTPTLQLFESRQPHRVERIPPPGE